MSLLELVKKSDGMVMVNEDGESEILKLLPGLSEAEILALQSQLPAPIPDDVKALLACTAGFANGPLESLNFVGIPGGFGLEEIFPHGLSFAHDGFGNYWVIDLTSKSREWGPVFYACHDPAVIVFQAETLEQFIEDVVRFSNPPHQADLDRVHEEFAASIWDRNPNVLSYEDCINSQDAQLSDFARSLDATFQIIDLRKANLGDGFSWGRYGPRAVLRRYGEERIFAYQIRKSIFQRLFGK